MTGLTISEILKQGVAALEEQARQGQARRPYDIYRELDLGAGGHSLADARSAKSAIADVIRRKHDR